MDDVHENNTVDYKGFFSHSDKSRQHVRKIYIIYSQNLWFLRGCTLV